MKKNTMKDLAPIAIPHGPPVESTAEYFKSKMETANMTRWLSLVIELKH